MGAPPEGKIKMANSVVVVVNCQWLLDSCYVDMT